MTGCGSKTSEPPAASGVETAAGAGDKTDETEKKMQKKGKRQSRIRNRQAVRKVKLVGMTWGSTATIENLYERILRAEPGNGSEV